MNKINLFMIFLIGIIGVMVLAGLERFGGVVGDGLSFSNLEQELEDADYLGSYPANKFKYVNNYTIK